MAVAQLCDTAAADLALLPQLLVKACAQELPVAGVSITITDELRIPLAASNDDASTAERIQTTLGEGPCLTAAGRGVPFHADRATAERHWPLYSREMTARTPFRSVVSLPLGPSHGRPVGALTLYSTDPAGVPVSLTEVMTAVAVPMASVLFDQAGPAGPDIAPAWLATPLASARMKVWVAIAMIIEHADVPSHDAIDLLRAHAFSHDTTLDHIATMLIDHELQPESLLA